MERFDINKELKNLEGLSVRAKCSALDDLCSTLREAISDISNAKMRFWKNTSVLAERNSSMRSIRRLKQTSMAEYPTWTITDIKLATMGFPRISTSHV